jgi:hypothetical protein
MERNKIALVGCFLWLLMFLTSEINAQELLLKRDVDSVLDRNERTSQEGAASRFFSYQSTGVGFFFPVGPRSQEFNPGKSLSLSWANLWQFRRSENQYHPAGVSLAFNYAVYGLNQSNTNPFSMGVIHKKQSLMMYNVSLGYFKRICFNRRGFSLGKYLDLGVVGEAKLASMLSEQDDLDPQTNAGARSSYTSYRRLTYIKPFSSYAMIRFGSGKLSVLGLYRLSSMFRPYAGIHDGVILADLCKWNCVIEVNLWKKTNIQYDSDEK